MEKKLILILVMVILLRLTACAVCSLHFEDVVISIILGELIFKCFCIYQLLRFIVSVFGEHFDTKQANIILSVLKKLFTAIVFLGCTLRFISQYELATDNLQIVKIFIESALIFFVFIIIELLVDIVFCLHSPLDNTTTKELIINNLTDYFWLSNTKKREETNDDTNSVANVTAEPNQVREMAKKHDSKDVMAKTHRRNEKKYQVSILKKLNPKIRLKPKKK